MASILFRPERPADSRWQATVRRKGFPAQIKSLPTKREAEAWAQDVEADMRRGAFIDTKAARDTTLGDLFKKYAEEVSPHKKGSAVEIDRLTRMRKWPLARYSVANATADVLAVWRDERLSVVSGSTVNRELNLMSHVFSTAMIEWRINIAANPISRIRRPKNNRSRERRIEGGEEALLLHACRKARNKFLYPAVMLVIETGMRRSEVVGIEWRLVDLEKRVVTLLDSKNGKGRSIPLSTRAVAALSAVATERTGRVFPDLTVNAIKCAYRSARKRAKITGLRLHDLRHEATSRLFEKGLNPMEVSSVTGASISMLRRYTHLRAEELALKLG